MIAAAASISATRSARTRYALTADRVAHRDARSNVIEFETTTRVAEARETLWRIYRGRVIFYALVFAVITVVLFRFQSGDLARLSLIWGLGWIAIFLCIWGAIIFVQGSKMAQRSSAHGPLCWTGSDDGFRVASGGSPLPLLAGIGGFPRDASPFLLPSKVSEPTSSFQSGASPSSKCPSYPIARTPPHELNSIPILLPVSLAVDSSSDRDRRWRGLGRRGENPCRTLRSVRAANCLRAHWALRVR